MREGLKALETAQEAFQRVSFDLIYARPGQTGERGAAQLERALGFGTAHLSLYQLTIEPGTRFATMVRQGDFEPLDDDAAADLFALTRELTVAAGLPAYEISNHAPPGEESRHNLTYWRYQDYAGIGPGAHGRRGGMATVRHKKPENWLASVDAERGHGIAEQRALVRQRAGQRSAADGPAARRGGRSRPLSGRFGIDRADRSGRAGLHETQRPGPARGSRVIVTDAGMPLLDALLGELVLAELVAA